MFNTNENGSDLTDRAVTPVIGIILMVAITVILAAVIGTFALDLGRITDTGPTASMTVQDADATFNKADGSNDQFVIVEHEGGDELDANNMKIIVRRDDNSTIIDSWEGGSWSESPSDFTDVMLNDNSLTGSDTVTTGDILTWDTNDGNEGSALLAGDKYAVVFIDTDTETKIAEVTVKIN